MQRLLLTKVSSLRKTPRIASNLKDTKIKKRLTNESNFDVQGSYTGVDAYDKYEKPVQDADYL